MSKAPRRPADPRHRRVDPPKAKRAQRAHGALPPGFVPRPQADGSFRPRWIPQPAPRKAGWRSGSLVDDKGVYLSYGAAIDMAREINAAVAAWKAGDETPPHLAAFAPALSSVQTMAVAVGASIGALETAWLESNEYLSKSAATRRDYKNKLGRLLEAIAGYAQRPLASDAAGRARMTRDLATLRGLSIMTLEPVQQGDDDLFDPLYEAYWALHQHAGVNQASGVLAVASVWLNWIRKRKRREVVNWAKEVERETPPGRIRPATLDELRALIAAADANGYEDVADAAILSFDLSWSAIDILQLTEAKVLPGYRAHTARQKTGRKGGTPMTFIGRNRYDAILARRKDDKVQPLKAADRRVIQLKRERDTTSKRGMEADSEHLRRRFSDVRDLAALACPSIADLTFADLRDTAWTIARQAGLSDDQLASRTLQSRKHIKELGDRHYGEIGPEIADQGKDLLETYYRASGLAL
ncbi:site-specific integrase [Caulobacter hibisci]|uniref:Core-binding (CB) domain-containing protein n=1 Tax=Caulobacter hibisci TaxID=2035993 RepID=A0ABS0SXT8_9CAUL|nr:hypothetical protein [Caulobacter hibisci]MBI1684424.1 hypothetical protein [Caulobacter hibisci]